MVDLREFAEPEFITIRQGREGAECDACIRTKQKSPLTRLAATGRGNRLKTVSASRLEALLTGALPKSFCIGDLLKVKQCEKWAPVASSCH